MTSNVVSQISLLVSVSGQSLVQSPCLNVFSVIALPGEWTSSAGPDLLILLELDVLGLELVGRGVVVRGGTQVAVDVHSTVSHVWVENTSHRTVDWDLLVVDTQPVSVSVRVREQSRLQDWVGGCLHVWNGVGRRESNLLNLSEVVRWVLVQDNLTKSSQWVVLVWPDLGQVKDREWSSLGLFSGHGLDVTGPGWVVALGDLFEQVLLGVVWIRARQLTGLLVGQVSDSLVSEEVYLDVVPVALLVEPLVSVAGVTIHLSVGSWGTTIGEQDHHLVDGLRVINQVVPEHVGILQVGLGVSFLSVNEVRKLGGVTEKEDRRVVVYHVQVTFLGVQLDGETTGISGGVRRTGLPTYSGETVDQTGALADFVQEGGAADVGDVIGDLEVTESTGTLSVDHPLRDSLSVKVCEGVNQVEVLQQQGTVLANALRGEWVRDRSSIGVSVNRRHNVFVGKKRRGAGNLERL